MIKIDNGSLSDFIQAANTGALMEAEIISLTGLGKLRVTCNWLYSSLNCDPNDNSPAIWQFNKIDNDTISLSPKNSCINQPIFASIRPDIEYYVEVQAPYSADWITAVGSDERIVLSIYDLSIGVFGQGSSYIRLNDTPDTYDTSGGQSHTGYRVRCLSEPISKSCQWFIGVQNSLQSEIQFSGMDNSRKALERQLLNCKINLDNEVMERVETQLNTVSRMVT